MRKLLIFVIFGLAISSVAADKLQETLEQLKQRAESTPNKKKQVELFVELAQRQLESANDAYNSNVEQAKTLFGNSADSAESAARAAIETNHKLKQTEIKLRELSHRMTDIRRTWAFEDRAPLDPAIQKVESSRNKLLDRMFQK